MNTKTFLYLICCIFILSVQCSRERKNPLDYKNPNTKGNPFDLKAEVMAYGIFLTWNKLEMKTVNGYNIYRKLNNSKNFQLLSFIKVVQTTYKDTTVTGGELYYYKISAIGEDGESGYSDTIEINANRPPETILTVAPTDSSILTTTEIMFSFSGNDPDSKDSIAAFSTRFDNAAWSTWFIDTTKTIVNIKDGFHFFEVRAKDSRGAIDMSPANVSFFTDTQAPLGNSIVINMGAEFSNEENVELSLLSTNAFEMCISNDVVFDNEHWQPFKNKKNWQLSMGDGIKIVFAKFRDLAQNETPVVSDSIILDTIVKIHSVTENTNGLKKKIGDIIHFTLDANEMGGEAKVDIGTARVGIDLYDDGSNGDTSSGDGFYERDYIVQEGDEIVNGQIVGNFVDRAGNIADKFVASSKITIDATPPINVDIDIDQGRFTNSQNISLSLNADNAVEMQISNDGFFDSEVWELNKKTKNWILTANDGQKQVFAKFRDEAGNKSKIVSDTTFLDTVNPISLKLKINDGASYTNNILVALELDALESGSGLGQMIISNDGNFDTEKWLEFYKNFEWNLTSGDGTKNVYARVKDRAGNESTVATENITLDMTPPIINSVTENTRGNEVTEGDVIHFSIISNETEGVATVDISNINMGIKLFDDGTNGDVVANDGVYEKDYIVLVTDEVQNAIITGHLIDRAGNAATPVNALGTISVDVSPPIISNVAINNITDSSAVISWQTDEPSNSTVNYGFNTSFGLTASDTSMVISHEIVLIGLDTDSEYFFEVTSQDKFGYKSSIGPNNFKTKFVISKTFYGFIKQDATMLKSRSPYTITGDVFVQENVTLTIEPGTIITFEPNSDILGSGDFPDKSEFIINGTLVAEGFLSDSIKFISSSFSKNIAEWGQIKITSDNSIIKYCVIENSHYGLYLKGNPYLKYVQLSNNRFSFNNTGVYANDFESPIEYCLFENNEYGIEGNPREEIRNNIIRYNKARGINISYARSNIKNNRIYSNRQGVTCAGASNIWIDNNIIYNNDEWGISLGGSGEESYINYNTIYNNKQGGLTGHQLKCEGNIITNHNSNEFCKGISASASIVYCNVWNNSQNFDNCQAGEGTISINPFFIAPDNGGFHLSSNSPCLTAGRNNNEIGAYGNGGNPPDID